MNYSILIVKFWGYFFLAFSIPLFLSSKSRETLLELAIDKSFIFMSGFISLIMCIPLVLINNVWSADIVGFTTFIAWMGIAKGIIRISNPEIIIRKASKFKDKSLRIVGIITLLLGAGMVYAGYFPYWC
jgi:uncharacterized protein YjeT (DUF2065 family)